MRVWLAPSAFAPHVGGVEELSLKLARHLQDGGHDVLVVTHREPTDLPAVAMVDGVDVRRVRFPAPARWPRAAADYLASRRRVSAALDDLALSVGRPDVVHVVCAAQQTDHLDRWCRHTGVPLVVTTQGETVMDAHDIYGRSTWMRSVLRRASEHAVGLTACSTWTAEQAATIAPRFARARVILNGVDPHDWAVPDDLPVQPVVGAWGRHVQQKGFDLLLDAWPRVRAHVPGARLLLGGDGPETPRLRSLASPGVELLGPLARDAVRERLLAATRVVVVPSRLEPFGIVAVEALAAGRSVVYSTTGGLGEATGGLGVGVDPTDPQVLAAAVITMLRHPDDPRRCRARAQQLSWSLLTREYENVYARGVRHR